MNSAKRPVFKCVHCGAVIETLNPCNCETCGFICCGEPMRELKSGTSDGAVEKHVPVVTASAANTVKVNVGSMPHPMTEEHFIMWIEVWNGACLARKYLHHGEVPEVEFCVPYKRGLTVRAYCNLHGLYETIVE